MTKILIKRGTATQWTNSTTPLLSGELGLDTSNNILKVGNGTALWNSLSGLTLSASQVDELAQDAIASAFNHQDHSNIVVTYDDSNNKITLSTGPDVVTSSDLGNSLGDYVPLADVGNADGVAPLDENSLIPDEYIPSTIARDSEIPSLTGYATETYVSTAISNLVDSAPTTLDTLNELAAALGDDPNYATTITTALGDKVSKSGGDTIISSTTSTTSLIIKSIASQTANLFEVQNPSGAPIFAISPIAELISYRRLSVIAPSASTAGLIVRGAASQTADLQQWQDSNGTALAKITATGDTTFGYTYISGVRDVNATGAYINMQSADGVLLNTRSASNRGIIIKGAASQTADLQQWQNSAGTKLAWINSNGSAEFVQGGVAITGGSSLLVSNDIYSVYGKISTGNGVATPLGQITTVAGSASTIGLVVRGVASQTANLQEWQDSAGTVFVKIDSNGHLYTSNKGIYLNSSYVGNTRFFINSSATTMIGAIIKGAASQTANLTEWQDSAGTAQTVISSSGRITSKQRMSIGFPVATALFDAHNNFSNDSDATRVIIIARAAASQTADLQQWQNSAGTVLARINSAGSIIGTSDLFLTGGVAYFNSVGDTNGTFISVSSGRGNFVLQNASAIGLIVKGSASQTANLQEWQNSSGTVLASVSSDGNLIIGQKYISYTAASAFARFTLLDGFTNQTILYPASAGFLVQNLGVTGMVILKVKGVASQTGDLQQWQNNSGTVLAKVDASGAMFTTTAAVGTDTTQVATTEFVQTALSTKLDSSGFTYASITIPVYSTIGDLPSAADNHGRWAHVHGEGAMCFAHGGAWYKALSETNLYVSTNSQGGSYTLATSDLDKMVEMSGGGTLTITDSSSFPVGFTCNILQTGSSQVTIAGNGFTPNATPGLKLRAQWSSATLIKRSLNSWVVMGDLSA